MFRNYRVLLCVFVLLALVPALVVWSQTKGTKVSRRAAPPKFNPSDTKGTFFDNIFDGKVLQGERPADIGSATPANVAKANGGGAGAATSAGSGASTGGGGWSKIISASAIEDEVKATKKDVDKDVTTPTDFAGKGYKVARRHFSTLAMLFAIAGDYDGDVRWKNDAPTARDLFARTAANAKVGTQQVYNEAKLRKGDLQEMVGGGGLPNKGGDAAEAKVVWSKVCDRSPLMQRLEMSMEPKLQPWTADKNNFKANKEQILHEAQIIAAIGEVLMKEGMADADGAEYKAFCEKLKKAALDVVDAVKLDSDDNARKAVGEISRSCTSCHENYRA